MNYLFNLMEKLSYAGAAAVQQAAQVL